MIDSHSGPACAKAQEKMWGTDIESDNPWTEDDERELIDALAFDNKIDP